MSKAWEIKTNPPESHGKKMLDIEMFVYGETLLVGRILHQDESLRCVSDTKLIYQTPDYNLAVKSASAPAMDNINLYLRGTKREKDNQPLFYKFDSAEQLKNYVCNVKKALHEINKTAKPAVAVEGAFKKVL